MDGVYSGKSNQNRFFSGVPPFQETSMYLWIRHHITPGTLTLDFSVAAGHKQPLPRDTEETHGGMAWQLWVSAPVLILFPEISRGSRGEIAAGVHVTGLVTLVGN